MKIRSVRPSDAPVWNRLRSELWPDHPNHDEEIVQFFLGKTCEPAAVFVAEDDDGALCGFAELSIRHDYVEGARSTPVAYLEGWYVMPDRRGCGVGQDLIAQAEQWAAACGLKELGSDAPVDNDRSLRAHIASGFQQTGVTVHFIKPLDCSLIPRPTRSVE